MKNLDERFREKFGIKVISNEDENDDVLRLKQYKQEKSAEIRFRLKGKMHSLMSRIETKVQERRYGTGVNPMTNED